MKAVVCGAGRVGYGIARELASEGNAVTPKNKLMLMWATKDKHITCKSNVKNVTSLLCHCI